MELDFASSVDRSSSRAYKTPLRGRARAKARRDAIKAAGGEAYQKLLDYERAARAKYRADHPDYWRKAGKKKQAFKTRLCARARQRARKRGIGATIRPDDLMWPSHCPVLGIELFYPNETGKVGRIPDNYPTLDRWDNKKGYVRGNVFVISFRANCLKNRVSKEEVLLVAKYVMQKPRA